MNRPGWVLRLLGLPPPDPARMEEHHADAVAWLQNALESVGWSWAIRRYAEEEAPLLPRHTVVELNNGDVALVRRNANARVELETPTGPRTLSTAQLLEVATGRALLAYPRPSPLLRHALWDLVMRDVGTASHMRSGLLAALLMRILALALPMLTYASLAVAIPNGQPSTLWGVSLGAALMGVFMGMLVSHRDTCFRYVESITAEKLSREVFWSILKQPFDALVARRPAAVWQDYVAVGQWARTLVPQLLVWVDGIFGLLFLVGLALFSPWAALLAGASGAAALAWAFSTARHQAVHLRTGYEVRRMRQTTMFQALDAMEVVRAENLGGRTFQHLRYALAQEHQAQLSLGTNRAVLAGLSAVWERGVFVALYALLGWQALEGKLTLAEFLTAVQLGTGFQVTFLGLLGAPEKLVAFSVMQGELAETLKALEPPPEKAVAYPTLPHHALDVAVSLNNVSYRHTPHSDWVFRGWSLQVKRGEVLRLSWGSGSGKTTLLRLVAGLHVPQKGVVLVGGSVTGSRSSLVCYLPQAALVLSRSVMDNVVAISGGARRKRIMEAAHITGLDALIEQWPMGWNTMLSGGGRTVSTGQRQLVLLTAAVASAAPVLLLDEALAHLDAQTRRVFLAKNPFAGKTVIMVEHGPADREVVPGERLLPPPDSPSPR